MHFVQLLALLAASTTSVVGVALPNGLQEGALTENPANILSKRDGFDCSGSGVCGSTPDLLRRCDKAVNTLRRGDGWIYEGSSDPGRNGNCWGNINGDGCGVFFEGPSDCKGSGDDMWWGYQQIRSAGCAICGYKYFTGEAGSDCKLKIDYVTGCNNRE